MRSLTHAAAYMHDLRAGQARRHGTRAGEDAMYPLDSR